MSPIIPVYYQIRQTIKGWIINGEFAPGEKMPSENEIAEKFGVARLTVRQAISQLTQEGLLKSVRGGGTFITDNKNLIRSLSLEFSGFKDDLFYQQSKVRAKSVFIDKIRPSRLIKDKLALNNQEEEVIQIKRVRLLRNKIFSYTVNYLPLEIGLMITEKELYKKPLLRIMEEDLGIQFTEAFQVVEASFADREVAEQLGIASGSPVLHIERIVYARKHKPVELVRSSYPGDTYKFILRLARQPGQDTWSAFP